MTFDKFMTDVNDYHLPFGLIVFIAGLGLQLIGKMDGTFIAFSTTVLTFIGTHAYVNSKSSNSDDGQTAPVPVKP